mgnify:CR=1 FL=1
MTSTDDATTAEPARPALRIVRGAPDEAELAALVAVLAARGGGEPEPEPVRSGWTDRTFGLRGRFDPGPGAWQRSARTR